MLFKNRAIQMQFVKPEKILLDDNGDGKVTYNPDYIAEVATKTITTTAVTIGGVFIAYRLVDTACKIAVIAAKAITR